MVNKRGWIRIMEVVLAVTIFSTVLLVIYSQQVEHFDSSVLIGKVQEQIIGEISINNNLRNMVLENNEIGLNDYFNSYVPINLGYYIRICNLNDLASPCKLHDYYYSKLYDKTIYTKILIISGNLSNYDPKMLNVFVWDDSLRGSDEMLCNILDFSVEDVYYSTRLAEEYGTGEINLETYIGFKVKNNVDNVDISGFNILVHHSDSETELLFSLDHISILGPNYFGVETTRLRRSDDVVKIKIIPRISKDNIVCNNNGILVPWYSIREQ